jgi:hypothetical protein
MKHIAGLGFAALATLAAAGPGHAQEVLPVDKLNGALAGNTVSAVMFLPHEDQVQRVMFQAFLRPDGSELVRRWDPAHDAYTAPANAHWTLTGDTLCLVFPGLGGDPNICIETHVWGPRISGNTAGSGRFAMVNGDIEPGNSIAKER